MFTTVIGIALVVLGTCAAPVPVIVRSILEHRANKRRKAVSDLTVLSDRQSEPSELAKAA